MTRRPGRAFWSLGPAILAGAAIRLTLLVSLADAPLFRAPLLDAAVYDQWARAIAAGSGSGPQAFFLAPLYPHLLAAIYALGGDGPLLAVALQHLAGLALVALCGACAWRWGGAVAGTATAWLLAVHGPLLVYENLLLAEVLAGCLLTPAVLLLASRPLGWRRAAAAGVLCGLNALVRPTGLLIGAALVLWLAWRRSPGRARLVLAMLLGMVIAVAPVTLRNRRVSGEWIWITTGGGYNLYVGNHAEADGTFVQPAGVRFVPGDVGDPSGRHAAEAALGRTLSDGEVSRYWLERTVAAVRAEPGRVAGLYLRKLALVWNRFEVPQIVDLREVRRESLLLRLIWPVAGIVLPLALLGLGLAYPGQLGRRPLIVAVISFTGVTALFFVTARYRVQILPLLAILAGGTVASLVERVRAAPRRLWRPGLMLVLCVLLTAPALLGLEGAGHPWIPPMNRALRLAATGADSSAVLAAFAEAFEHGGGGIARLHVNRGTYRLEIGNAAGARRDFARAVELDGADPAAWTGLGRALLHSGQVVPAIDVLRRARQIDRSFAPASLALAQALERAGRHDEAEGVARAALAGADSSGAHAVLGMILRRSGDLPGGLAHLERAAALAPEQPAHQFNLGLALIEEERYGAARRALEQAVQSDPDYRQAALALAALLMESGEFGAARVELQRLMRTTPGDPRLASLLAEVERRRAATR